MRKSIVYILCSFIILVLCFMTGCNQDKQELHKYNNAQVNNFSIKRDIAQNDSSRLLSNNICVIDKTLPATEDGAVTSGGALLINVTKNECVFSRNIYTRLYPASLTKCLTALCALRKCNVDDIVTITKESTGISESGAKLCSFKEGDTIKLGELLKCMMVYSGNDAALAVGIHVSGSQEAFAAEMNKTCKLIGANQSNFVNPHGLHNDNQYTTPYDLYLILNELVKYPAIFDIYGLPSVEATYTDAAGNQATKTFKATNKYILNTVSAPENVTVLGGKTGTTNNAGSCLILHCENKTNQDKYIAVVLNANSSGELYSQMTHILSYIK